MANALLAPGMLFAVLAFALAFLDLRPAFTAAAIAAAACIAGSILGNGWASEGTALTACWISLLASAACAYWPWPLRRYPALCYVLAANAGLWAGLVAAAEGAGGVQLAATIAPLILLLPARYAEQRGWAIALRVVTSWLLAVAILAAALPFLVEHPGYVADHRL